MAIKYVIIGNGFAGIRAIESIRELDTEGSITVISDEENYSRPLISYYLGKKIELNALTFRNLEFFEKMNVSLKIGSKVTQIEPTSKEVLLANGEKVSFDKLLIATGGDPFVPPIEGSDAKGVFTFYTKEDAFNIEQYISNNDVKSAIILGGGLIGLKATEALMDLKINTTVVELADRILSLTFDKKASGIIEKALVQSNCEVITQDTFAKINVEHGKATGVTLKEGGQAIEGKLVIIAVGVRPTVDLLKNSETKVKVDRGIVVNQLMETDEFGIYAAGDCAQPKSGVVAILPIAARQGIIAGTNMAASALGKAEAFVEYGKSMPMNSVSLAEIPTISVGLTDPKEDPEDYEIIEKYSKKEGSYKKIILQDNIIVGIILIKDIDRAGIYTGLIKDEMDVTTFKDDLLKDTFGLVSLPKGYRKHKVEGRGMLL